MSLFFYITMKYIRYILIALFACMVIEIVIQDRKIENLTQERDKYKQNTEILLGESKTYKVRDSLNAIKVESLELTMKEYEKYRAEDAGLIKDLKKRNEDLKAVNKTQQETIIRLSAIPRDTVVLIDSIPIKAKKVQCGDDWYTFKGLVTDDTFEGTLENRDSILISESVRYKKFLWFKTKKIKSREIKAVSLNPHTKILGMEHILIDN